jgi:hypothetical protein
MNETSIQEMADFFLSRWSELKNRDKQIRSILLTNNYFALLGSAYITNVLRSLSINPTSTTENEGILSTPEKISSLLHFLQDEAMCIESEIAEPRGFILKQGESIMTESGMVAEPFVDYSPFKIVTGEGESCLSYGSFNECLDLYFVNEESQKVAERAQKCVFMDGLTCRSKEAIEKKVNTIAVKQDQRVKAIQEELLQLQRRINVMFNNSTIVNTAILVINKYLSQGVQWNVLEEQVRLFKQKPYNVFHHIKSLDLEHNRMKMEFECDDDDDDDEENEEEENDNESGYVNVDVELSMNANNNIALLYKQKKEMEDKLVGPHTHSHT